MNASRLSRSLLPLAAAALLIAGCSAPATSSAPADGGTDASQAADAPAAEAPAGSGGSYGCTDGMLAYLADHAYADVPPVDPATFTFPDGVDIAATPTCFVSEELGPDSRRSSAIFVDDPAGVLAQAQDAFAAAGWQGSLDPTIGGIWWSDGPEVTAAKYSVGGGPLEIDGKNVAWFTWGY